MNRFCIALVVVAACGDSSDSVDTTDDPVVESVAPSIGGITGGTEVTITGLNLDGEELGVLFGERLATNVVVVSATEVVATTPAGAASTAPVSVTVFAGNGQGSLSAGYQYAAPVDGYAVTPAVGKAGMEVTVTGSGFMNDTAGDTRVWFGDAEATAVAVSSDSTLVATVPAPGDSVNAFVPVDLTVQNGNGAHTFASSFSYTKQGLLFTRKDDPRLWFVDPEEPGTPPRAFAQLDIGGVCVGGLDVAEDGSLWASTRGPLLAKIDPFTGKTLEARPIQGGDVPRPFAVARQAGKLYGLQGDGCCSDSDLDLDVLSIAGEVVETSAVSLANLHRRGCMIAKGDDQLVFLGRLTDGEPLQTFTVANGIVSTNVSAVTLTGGNGSSCMGGTVYNDTVYVSNHNGQIFTLNTDTGEMSLVLDAGNRAVRGLTRTPPSF